MLQSIPNCSGWLALEVLKRDFPNVHLQLLSDGMCYELQYVPWRDRDEESLLYDFRLEQRCVRCACVMCVCVVRV